MLWRRRGGWTQRASWDNWQFGGEGMLWHSHQAAPRVEGARLSPQSGKNPLGSFPACSCPPRCPGRGWQGASEWPAHTEKLGGALVFQSLTFSMENSAPGSSPVLFRGLRTQARCQEEWAKLKVWKLSSPLVWANPKEGAQRRRGFGPCRQAAPASSSGAVDRAFDLGSEGGEASRGPGTGVEPGIGQGRGCR